MSPMNESYTGYAARSLANSALVAASTLAYRADLLYAQNIINNWNITGRHGILGESTIDELFLKNRLGQSVSGGWQSISARINPGKAQGFDHVFIRYEDNGMPKIMVAETKFGKGELGITKHGSVRQLSPKWIESRRIELGKGYAEVATADVVFKAKNPEKCAFLLEVPAGDGAKVRFFKDSEGNLCFTGSPDQLASARKTAKDASLILSNTNCDVKCRLFKVDTVGKDIVITVADVNPSSVNLSTKAKDLLANGKQFKLEGILDKKLSNKDILTAVEKRLRRDIPGLTKADAEEITQDLVKKLKTGDFLKTELIDIGKIIAKQSAYVAVTSLLFDSAIQLISTQRIDAKRSAVTTISAAGGSASGQVIAYFMLKNRSMYGFSLSFSRTVGLGGTKLVRGVFSSTAGGAVAALIMAYGGLAFGMYDLKQANQNAAIGLSGTAAGGLAYVGATSLVYHFGTCGTGAAINSLHGAAATNAIMAKFGGGTLASGGFGASGGAVVLGGIVAVAAIATSAAVAIGIKKHGESVDRTYYINLNIAYGKADAWTKIAERRFAKVY